MSPRVKLVAGVTLTVSAALLPGVSLASTSLGFDNVGPVSGTGTLAGQVFTVDGTPLPNVVLSDGRLALTKTDAQGRFLLQYVPAGKSVMRIDGRHGGVAAATDYGTYEVQVKALPNRVTALPFVSWLTPIDHTNDIVVQSPTTSEVVLSTPRIPGAEIVIPAGTILTDWDGKRINRISLTPIRPDRPPFPLPRDVRFADYFTAQPGGTTLWTVNGGRGAAKVIYPNHGNGIAGSRTVFWHYHPTTIGWMPYGSATVSADAKSIVPDEDATIYDFMGGGNSGDSGEGPSPDDTSSASGQTSSAGDPVDLASGLFTRTMTDLTLSDVMPISVTRNYMSSDTNYRDFGLGMSLSYEMYPFLGGGSSKTEASEEYSTFQMITPTSNVLFTNTTPAYGDYSDALFVAQTAPGPFLQAQAYWTGNGFEVKQRNGIVYAFGYHSPLTYMQDRFGNRVTLTYQQVASLGAGVAPTQSGNKLVKVASPNGRFVQFTWTDLYPSGKNSGYTSPTGNDLYVITKAVDNLGRETDYAYDACGRLLTVLDAHAIFFKTTNYATFAWTTTAPAVGQGSCPAIPGQPLKGQAPLNLLASITDASANLLVQNDQYEWTYTAGGTQYSGSNCETPAVSGQVPAVTSGRVCHQNLGPPGLSSLPTYSYRYTVDPYGNILTTVVTDPRSHTRKVDFTFPSALAAQQQAGVTLIPQSPGYASDDTYAADDSQNSQTWKYLRDPATQSLLEVTAPPLTEEGETTGRVTAFCYDNLTYPGSTAASLPFRSWNLTSVVRNLTSGGNRCPSTVQTGSTTQNATTLFTCSPTFNLVTSITDPNGNTTIINRGGANNPFEEARSITDANGNKTSMTYASNGQVQSTSQVASANQTIQSSFSYDHGDLTGTTGVGSDASNRVSSIYTDAIGRPVQNTDPLGDVSITRYDPIDGPARVQDANGSFETFAYTANGNLTQVSQPNGTTLFAYNQANLRSTFTDPLNAVASAYYDPSYNLICAIDRRGNQANFTYDSLDRPSTAIYYKGSTSGCTGTPGTVDSSVSYAYDHGNRLLTLTDSTGGIITRQFDDLDRLSSDAQAQAGSGASIGTVAYDYDLGSRLTSATPTNVNAESFAYDPGNRLIAITRASSYVCINYDQANRRTSLVYPSSTTANYSWDSLSDETQIAYTWNGSYTPGSGSTPATCTPGTGTPAGTGNLTYGYDQDGRQVARGGSFFTPVLPSPFAASTVAYNADNQQTLWNGLNNVFDGNGDLTCTGSSSGSACTGNQSQLLTWDARNRLVRAAGSPALGGSAETYVYDALSRRQSVSVPAAATTATYLYRGLDPVLVNTVSTSSGATVDNTKVFLGLGLDERFQVNGSASSNTGTVITDSQNSTVQLEGNLTTNVAYSYPPFGSLGAATTSSVNPVRYTGREASNNTGLYYYRARYYSPGQSRFIQEDPLGLIAGPDIYAYANNDPLDLIDPLGLCSTSGPQNLTQLLGLILATEVAGLGPEDPAADAAVVGEIAAYEGGAFAAANTVRALTAADLGVDAGALTQLSGTVSAAGSNVTVNIGMIEGSIANPFGVIGSLSSMASAQGASTLTIEASIANPALLNILVQRYGAQTIGGIERIVIPLGK